MAENVDLVKIDLTAINKQIVDTTNNIVSLEEANKGLRKDMKKTDEELKNEGKSRAALNLEIAKNSQKISEEKKARKDNITLINSENNSLDQLKNKQKSLITERKKLNTATADGAARLKEINKELRVNQDAINEASEGFANYTGNTEKIIAALNDLKKKEKQLIAETKAVNTTTETGVALYRELNTQLATTQSEIKLLSTDLEVLNSDSVDVNDNTEAMGGGFAWLSDSMGAAGVSSGGLIDSLKGFITNPYVAILAAIAGAVALITGALKESRAGANAMGRAMAGLSAKTDIAKKKFREFAEGMAVEFDENGAGGTAKKMLKQTTDSMVDFVKSIAAGDIKGAIERNVTAGFRAAGKEVDDFNKQADKLKDIKVNILGLKDAFADLDNELSLNIAKMQGYGEIQNLIADDDTRSFQERRKAAVEAGKATEEEAKLRLTLANEQLKIEDALIQEAIAQGHLRKEQDGTLKSLTQTGIELEKQYTETKVAAIEASNAVVTTRLENSQRLAKINLDDFEQELDFLLDIADRSKSINEQRIGDTRLAFEERKKILGETKVLVENSFDDQLALYERELEVQLDRSKLANLNNKEIFEYARGLGLSEIATNRLKEVIVERKQAVEDLIVAERDLNEEETTRKAEALEKLREYNLNRLLLNVESIEEEKAIMVEAEAEEYQRKLDQKNLLDEEIEAIEAEHLENMAKINDDYRKKEENEDKKTAAKKKEILNQFTSYAAQSAGLFFDFSNDLNEKRLETELAQNAGNEAKQEEIRKKYAEKRKDSAVGQAVANTALAIIKAFSTLGPIAGAISAALLTVSMGVQIGKIRSAKYADGGEVRAFDVSGPSHAAGGIPLHIGNKYAGEMQGGEGVFIINKQDNPEAMATYSAINSQHGKPFAPSRYMQDGGEAVTGSGGMSYEEALSLAEARPIIVRVVDINKGQENRVKVVNNSMY